MGFWDKLAKATGTPDGCTPNFVGECTRKDWRQYTQALRELNAAAKQLIEDGNDDADLVNWSVQASTRLFTSSYPDTWTTEWITVVPEKISREVGRLRSSFLAGLEVFQRLGEELPASVTPPRHLETTGAGEGGGFPWGLAVAGAAVGVGATAIIVSKTRPAARSKARADRTRAARKARKAKRAKK